MMSSCLSGSVISCTASLNVGASTTAPRRGDERDQDHGRAPAATGGDAPRGRRCAAASARRFARRGLPPGSGRVWASCGRRGVTHAAADSVTSTSDSFRSSSATSPSFDHDTSPAPPSPPGRAGAMRVRRPRRGPAPRPLGARTSSVGDDRDRRVVGGLHAGLEQQRRLDHGGDAVGGVRRHRLRAERDDARADPRPEQLLEPGALLRVGEGVRGDRGAVDHAVRARRRRPSARRRGRAPRRSAYSSWTTASVESVAAPSRSSAARAVDFPAPSPPVRADEGDRRLLGAGVRHCDRRLLFGVRSLGGRSLLGGGAPRPQRPASALGLSLGSRSLLGRGPQPQRPEPHSAGASASAAGASSATGASASAAGASAATGASASAAGAASIGASAVGA